MTIEATNIAIDGGEKVSALWQAPSEPRACPVLAHGAGAETHETMSAIAHGLAARGIATLRYQFPLWSGAPGAPTRRPWHMPPCGRAGEAAKRAPQLPLFAGGKSFGGRMTSQAQALAPMPSVHGLVFFGFPLHPAGKPSAERADHLASVRVPMLFLQGTRDALADVSLLRPLVANLGRGATLKLFEDADHSFHVPAKTGRKDADVLADILDAAAKWMTAI
jgi:predicted alpha/beta-hydrolase family hydrolase